MCFGGPSISMPTVEYTGPSQEDLDAQTAALDTFKDDLQTQQDSLTASLQSQIDAANEQAAELQEQLDAEMAAASAAAAAQQTAAIAATATETPPGEGAQTTEAIKKKKKPESTLKIARASLPSAAGAGLNISGGSA